MTIRKVQTESALTISFGCRAFIFPSYFLHHLKQQRHFFQRTEWTTNIRYFYIRFLQAKLFTVKWNSDFKSACDFYTRTGNSSNERGEQNSYPNKEQQIYGTPTTNFPTKGLLSISPYSCDGANIFLHIFLSFSHLILYQHFLQNSLSALCISFSSVNELK